jgi:hypothetical protein
VVVAAALSKLKCAATTVITAELSTKGRFEGRPACLFAVSAAR